MNVGRLIQSNNLMQMYTPNLLRDEYAARIIRFLLCACLAAPLLGACATSLRAAESPRHETATPTRLTARQ